MELVIFLLMFFLVFFCGVIIKYFKAYNLIAGYNTAPREIKEQVDAKALGDFIGGQLMIAAFAVLIGFALQRVGFVWGVEVGFILFLILIFNMVIKSRKIAPQLAAHSSSKKGILFAMVIVVAVAVGIAWTALPPSIELGDEQLAINGAYGVSVPYDDIEEILLVDKVPSLSMRTNGLGLGQILKGHFLLEDKSKALLFIRSTSEPVLIIQRQTKPEAIMISCQDATETRSLYKGLNAKLFNSSANGNAAAPNQNTRGSQQIGVDDFYYPPDYPQFEIRSGKRQLSWLKGDSNFTGKPGGIIGNTMFGMNEEQTDLLEPNVVKAESELVFAAASVPGLNYPDYQLYILDKNDLRITYPLNENTMVSPEEGGEYVFMLQVDWGNGDNSIDYWFKLKVDD